MLLCTMIINVLEFIVVKVTDIWKLHLRLLLYVLMNYSNRMTICVLSRRYFFPHTLIISTELLKLSC